ncbi:hypothetical protein CC86DRAFT_133027 [Ophiobolus disseminans]|uniref:Uncharacterized protein n=1 Tax=Ophiobolus disseminans TaxID=1469910 RepID=A0A6A7AE46_9PLEO|nr:hypothetical protein CC86DRAFT_133027 [Ophiobolus disseminans]
MILHTATPPCLHRPQEHPRPRLHVSSPATSQRRHRQTNAAIEHRHDDLRPRMGPLRPRARAVPQQLWAMEDHEHYIEPLGRRTVRLRALYPLLQGQHDMVLELEGGKRLPKESYLRIKDEYTIEERGLVQRVAQVPAELMRRLGIWIKSRALDKEDEETTRMEKKEEAREKASRAMDEITDKKMAEREQALEKRMLERVKMHEEKMEKKMLEREKIQDEKMQEREKLFEERLLEREKLFEEKMEKRDQMARGQHAQAEKMLEWENMQEKKTLERESRRGRDAHESEDIEMLHKTKANPSF